MFAQIHLLTLVVGVVIYEAIGMFWYSPMGFGDLWARARNINPENCKPTITHIISSAVIALITTWSLFQILAWTNATMLMHALTVGFVAWLGLNAASSYAHVIWAGKNLTVYAIEVAGKLVRILAICALYALWQ